MLWNSHERLQSSQATPTRTNSLSPVAAWSRISTGIPCCRFDNEDWCYISSFIIGTMKSICTYVPYEYMAAIHIKFVVVSNTSPIRWKKIREPRPTLRRSSELDRRRPYGIQRRLFSVLVDRTADHHRHSASKKIRARMTDASYSISDFGLRHHTERHRPSLQSRVECARISFNQTRLVCIHVLLSRTAFTETSTTSASTRTYCTVHHPICGGSVCVRDPSSLSSGTSRISSWTTVAKMCPKPGS